MVETVAEGGEDWGRVAEAVALRRAAVGFRRQKDAAKAADVGIQTWREIEGAKRTSYRPRTLAAVAQALRWPPDMLRRIADGEDPPTEAGELYERVDALEREVSSIREAVEEIRRLLLGNARSAGAPPGEAT